MLARLRADRRGTILLILAAGLMPILGLAALALDVGQQRVLASRLRIATDAAALAAVRMPDDATQRATAGRFLHSNLAGTPVQNLDFDAVMGEDDILSVTASATVPTSFMNLFGYETLPINTVSRATAGGGAIDIALLLDSSDSMNNSGRLVNLRAAAHAMIDEFEDNGSAAAGLRMAIVPYSHFVALDLNYADWMTNPDAESAEDAGRYCPAPRSAPHTLSNARATLHPFTHDTEHTWSGCEVTTLLPLTTSVAAWRAKVNALDAHGADYIEGALAFGWRVLDPAWSTDWQAITGEPGGDPDTAKHVVLMSGDYSNFSDEDSVTLCGTMASVGITVSTVAFDAPARGERLMEDCAAAGGGTYHQAGDGSALAAAFLAIASSLRDPRLVN